MHNFLPQHTPVYHCDLTHKEAGTCHTELVIQIGEMDVTSLGSCNFSALETAGGALSMIQCQGLEREVALSKDKQGTWGLGGSDCSVYCSHGTHQTRQLLPSFPGQEMHINPPTAAALPSLRWRTRQDMSPSLPAVCPVFVLSAELSAGKDDLLRISGTSPHHYGPSCEFKAEQ